MLRDGQRLHPVKDALSNGAYLMRIMMLIIGNSHHTQSTAEADGNLIIYELFHHKCFLFHQDSYALLFFIFPVNVFECEAEELVGQYSGWSS